MLTVKSGSTNAQRIVVFGSTGAGKTTLGKNLALKTGLPSFDLDEIYWLPHWQTRDPLEANSLIDEITRKPAWIISGNFRDMRDTFLQRADTIIWLDYPFYFVFWRVLRRSILRIVRKDVICNGNYDTWRIFFSKKSPMIWLFRTFYKRRQSGKEIFSKSSRGRQYDLLTLIRFRRARETQLWIDSI